MYTEFKIRVSLQHAEVNDKIRVNLQHAEVNDKSGKHRIGGIIQPINTSLFAKFDDDVETDLNRS